ncbi:hypothetical protein VTO42DRAFT_5914 [Malbranchea cinnamomea]
MVGVTLETIASRAKCLIRDHQESLDSSVQTHMKEFSVSFDDEWSILSRSAPLPESWSVLGYMAVSCNRSRANRPGLGCHFHYGQGAIAIEETTRSRRCSGYVHMRAVLGLWGLPGLVAVVVLYGWQSHLPVFPIPLLEIGRSDMQRKPKC